MEQQHKELAVHMLCVVCDRGEKGRRTQAIMEAKRTFVTLMSLGHGTANSRVLGYLGLGETEKDVFLSVMPIAAAQETMHQLDEELQLDHPGHGVAFAIELKQGCYHKPVAFTGKEAEQAMTQTSSTHDLILVVLNRGYTEEVMALARAAGATGGTVLHARGCGLAGAEKFFGVTIQPEREMILIAAKNDVSSNIMANIAAGAGPHTDAGAVSFSMPLAEVKGIGQKLALPEK